MARNSRARRAVGVASAVLLSVVGLSVPASAQTMKPSMDKVSCGSRTDWLRIWTQHHGFPVCYANSGSRLYGNNPPHNTWTTYGICAGNNRVYFDYFVWEYDPKDFNGSWILHDSGGYIAKGECQDFTSDRWYGEPVELRAIAIL